MTNPTGLTDWGKKWLEDPDGGGSFTRQRNAILAHDQTCEGLADVWLPRKGGRSAIGDLMECHGCGITFFWEGLRVAFEDCPESNHWYCPCCFAKTTACSCASENAAS
ncbi:hypothetical protein [Streptomyces sp. NPDC093269]|uniref:hypothetical protein n=1 Tax=Streptomyces sp. NPDC093269 TaxID=3366038 RepID=UPI00382D0E5F